MSDLTIVGSGFSLVLVMSQSPFFYGPGKTILSGGWRAASVD